MNTIDMKMKWKDNKRSIIYSYKNLLDEPEIRVVFSQEDLKDLQSCMKLSHQDGDALTFRFINPIIKRIYTKKIKNNEF